MTLPGIVSFPAANHPIKYTAPFGKTGLTKNKLITFIDKNTNGDDKTVNDYFNSIHRFTCRNKIVLVYFEQTDAGLHHEFIFAGIEKITRKAIYPPSFLTSVFPVYWPAESCQVSVHYPFLPMLLYTLALSCLANQHCKLALSDQLKPLFGCIDYFDKRFYKNSIAVVGEKV